MGVSFYSSGLEIQDSYNKYTLINQTKFKQVFVSTKLIGIHRTLRELRLIKNKILVRFFFSLCEHLCHLNLYLAKFNPLTNNVPHI